MDKISNYPPGPCGVCGEAESVCITSCSAYMYDQGEQTPEYFSGACYSCKAPMVGEVVDCRGGKPGYAYGLPGPKLESAAAAAGWKSTKIKSVLVSHILDLAEIENAANEPFLGIEYLRPGMAGMDEKETA